jgi:hypothetical protein
MLSVGTMDLSSPLSAFLRPLHLCVVVLSFPIFHFLFSIFVLVSSSVVSNPVYLIGTTSYPLNSTATACRINPTAMISLELIA